MKATQGTTYRSLQARIEQMSVRLQDLRNMAASGKKLTKASDDPAAIRPVLNARAQIRATERYLSTTGSAMEKMQTVDGHLDHVENLLVRVKELTIAGISGAASDADRNTLADQVVAMRAELLDTANTQMDGKYIFSGYAETTRPFEINPGYDAANPVPPNHRSITYSGDGNATRLEISPGETVQVSITGNTLFLGDTDNDGTTDSGGTDIFTSMSRIEAALRGNDLAAMENGLEAIDRSADQARMIRSKMGNNAQRIETAMSHLETTRDDMKQILSHYEDADIIETITSLTQQETAFEAALNVTAKVSRLSILNFL